MSKEDKTQQALDAATNAILEHGFTRSFVYINDGKRYHFTKHCNDNDIVDLICGLQDAFPDHFNKAMILQLNKIVSHVQSQNEIKH